LIVVDASAVVSLLLQLEEADAVMARVLSGRDRPQAPHLLDLEVAQVVRRYWRAGDITAARGEQAIRDLADLPLERHSHEPLLGRIWQLRNNVTACDAAYIALAEALDAPLLTLDSALSRVPGVRIPVEVV
jgi:predicted nucleic acid-binding protein